MSEPRIRAEIQKSPESVSNKDLAAQYGVSVSTIRRWRYRDDVHDRPHTRHNLLATLTPAQETVLIAAREYLRLGLDDLLAVAREFLNPALSRSALHRMLKRRQVLDVNVYKPWLIVFKWLVSVTHIRIGGLILGVVVACLCSLMFMNTLLNEI